MSRYIITVKLPKNPDHNPHNKLTGTCPVNGAACSDVTGEHHSFLVYSITELAEMRKRFPHITRVEQLP